MVILDGLLPLGLTFWVVSIVNDITNVEITNKWVANNKLCFDGVIKIKCAEDVTNGWKIYLKSSQRLSTFTSNYSKIIDVNSSFILQNHEWNSRCLAGETIRLLFTGCTSKNDTLPQMKIEFHRNNKMCPKITPPSDYQSMQVPTVLIYDDNFTFRTLLNISLPVTVQGNWVIYLAVATQLSNLNVSGVKHLPELGHIFAFTNLHWREMFIAGVTYILEIEGKKEAVGIKNPCITAVLAWKKSMEINPSTTTSNAPSTTSYWVQQKLTPSLLPSLSKLPITSSSAISTRTEQLQSIAFSQIVHSTKYHASSVVIKSSPTILVQPSTTTELGGTVLQHECGDVTLPSGYYHIEASVRVLTDWPQGFTAQITFTTTTDVRDGWQVELVMNKAISSLNVYTVTTTASSGKRFTLHNKDYNKQIGTESFFIIDFEAAKETENDDVPCMRAVFIWAIEEPCPKIDIVSGGNSTFATASIINQWNEGITGNITVLIPAEIQSGWQIEVLFDIPLTLEVYDAISSPLSGTRFTLMNKSYNKNLDIGHFLVVTFTATKQEIGATVLCVDAVFYW